MKSYNIYKIYGLRIKSRIEFDELLIDTDINDCYDVEIYYGKIDDEMKELFKKGKSFYAYKNDVYFHSNDVAYYHISNGNMIIVEPYKESKLEDIKSYIVGICLGHLLYQKGILAIHGGALGVNNKGLVIVGESGSGKSTLTTALRLEGFEFLADDIATMDLENIAMVCPGYPGQRLCEDGMSRFNYDISKYTRIDLNDRIKYTIPVWESFVKNKLELGMICEIAIGDVDELVINEITAGEKLKLLLRNVYCLRWVKHLGVDPVYFKKCVRLATEIPMYRIIRPREGFTVNEQVKIIKEIVNNKKVKKVV